MFTEKMLSDLSNIPNITIKENDAKSDTREKLYNITVFDVRFVVGSSNYYVSETTDSFKSSLVTDYISYSCWTFLYTDSFSRVITKAFVILAGMTYSELIKSVLLLYAYTYSEHQDTLIRFIDQVQMDPVAYSDVDLIQKFDIDQGWVGERVREYAKSLIG